MRTNHQTTGRQKREKNRLELTQNMKIGLVTVPSSAKHQPKLSGFYKNEKCSSFIKKHIKDKIKDQNTKEVTNHSKEKQKQDL